METITGPQTSPTQRDYLAEMAVILGLTTLTADVSWVHVTNVHRLPGWATCPIASADVAIADACDVPMVDIVIPAVSLPVRSAS